MPEVHGVELNWVAVPDNAPEIVKGPDGVTLSGRRRATRGEPVADPPLEAKANVGGFTLVGVLTPLSVQTLPRLQNPCSVGGLAANTGLAVANAAPASAIINTRRITNTLPLPLKGAPAPLFKCWGAPRSHPAVCFRKQLDGGVFNKRIFNDSQ